MKLKVTSRLTPELCEKIMGDEYDRPIGHNTRLKRFGQDFVVTFYGTDILRIRPDGTVVLNAGKFKTVTTKDRLNTLGPVRIHAHKGVWKVGKADFFNGFVYGDPVETEMRRAGCPDGILRDYLEEKGRVPVVSL